MLVEQPRQLADSHCVPRRYRKLSDERGELRLQPCARHIHTVDRIRTITDDDALAIFLSRAHTICQRINESVDATANVLHVETNVSTSFSISSVGSRVSE